MEVITIDGQKFVKASVAARQAGYTADYVGQLARAGSIPARLVGRTWYVDADVLRTHRVEKKRAARVKAREQVKQALAERKKNTGEEEGWKSHAISKYERDQADLIPAVPERSVAVHPTADESTGKEVSAEVEHIEEESDEGETTYKAVAVRQLPTDAKSSASTKTPSRHRQIIAPRKQVSAATPTKKESSRKSTRTARHPKQPRREETSANMPKRRFPLFSMCFFILCLILGAALSILEVREVYRVVGEDSSMRTEYVLNLGALISIIHSKI